MRVYPCWISKEVVSPISDVSHLNPPPNQCLPLSKGKVATLSLVPDGVGLVEWWAVRETKYHRTDPHTLIRLASSAPSPWEGEGLDCLVVAQPHIRHAPQRIRFKSAKCLQKLPKSRFPFDKWEIGRYNGHQSHRKGEHIVKKFAATMMNMMEMCMCSMCMRRCANFPMCFLMS